MHGKQTTQTKREFWLLKRAIEIFIDVFASSSCPTLKRQMNEWLNECKGRKKRENLEIKPPHQCVHSDIQPIECPWRRRLVSVHTIDVLQTDTSHTCKNPIPNTSFLVLNHHTSVSIRDTLFIAVQKSPEQSSSAVITLINPKLVRSCNFTIPCFPLTSDLLLPT
jgi:hypothetical protein